MSGVDLKKSQPFATLGYLEKSERFTGKIRFFLGWTCYTCENTSPFSRKSRVLHTFGVCAPTGVYKMKGGPHSSHHFAFSKNIVDNFCAWRWKYYLCSYQEFYQKRVSKYALCLDIDIFPWKPRNSRCPPTIWNLHFKYLTNEYAILFTHWSDQVEL